MTPASKEEIYLAKLCGEDWKLPYPASRLEYYYAKLCGMDVPLPAEPLSHPELYLAYLCGMDVKLPEPVSRKEMYMAMACGMEIENTPEPLSRVEQYWYLYIHHTKKVTSELPIVFDGNGTNLANYRIYGNSIQNSIPAPEHPIPLESVGISTDNGYKISVICTSEDNNTLNSSIYLEKPLRKIGDYADYIDFENQCVIRQIKESVLTGEENWNFVKGPATINRFTVSFDATSKGINARSLCTAFKYSASEAFNTVHFFNYRTALFIYAEFDSLTVFKNWLAQQYANGTPVIVYYVLDSSVVETLNLPAIPTFNGINTININTVIKPSQMYIEYH